MSRQEVTQYFDDVDGKELDPEDVNTVEWQWLGVDYRFDTSTANLDKVESGKVTVAKLLEISERIGGRRKRVSATTGASKEQTQAIRDWANANGYEVSDRGRIKKEVVEAFEAAH